MKTYAFVIGIFILFFACSDKKNPIKSKENFEPVSSRDYTIVNLPEAFGTPMTISNLSEAYSNIKGIWFGTVTTPWVKPYHVILEFNDNNLFKSFNITNNGFPSFYYGMDGDTLNKEFAFKNILSDGSIEGKMEIVFSAHNTRMDQITDLFFYNNYKNVMFDFWHYEYGPISFKLYKLNY